MCADGALPKIGVSCMAGGGEGRESRGLETLNEVWACRSAVDGMETWIWTPVSGGPLRGRRRVHQTAYFAHLGDEHKCPIRKWLDDEFCA